RREMDSPDAQMDDDRVVLSDRGNFARSALGVRSARLGRLLGLGSGGKCITAALAYRNGVSALRDDAGKARHDEGVERLARLHHVLLVHPWDDADPQRRSEFRARICAVEYRAMVCGVFGDRNGGLPRGIPQESRLSEERKSARLGDLAGIQFSI